MAPEKVTEMVLNVDLKCSGCYKKVKKVICKFPQIRDQVFDVDKNKVKIVVVCCSPEKIRDKLCYKGGGSIQSIEIIEKPDKPKPADKPKDAGKPKEPDQKAKPADAPKDAGKPKEPKPADKPKDAGKPQEPEKAKPADKPKDAGKPKEPEKSKADKPKEAKPADKPKDSGKPPEGEKPKAKDAEKPKEGGKAQEAPKKVDGANPDVAKMVFEAVQGYPQMYPQSGYPMLGYYEEGYGYGYGYGYGMPPPPPPSYGGFGYEYGNRGYHTNNDHVVEDNSEGCVIM